MLGVETLTKQVSIWYKLEMSIFILKIDTNVIIQKNLEVAMVGCGFRDGKKHASFDGGRHKGCGDMDGNEDSWC